MDFLQHIAFRLYIMRVKYDTACGKVSNEANRMLDAGFKPDDRAILELEEPDKLVKMGSAHTFIMEEKKVSEEGLYIVGSTPTVVAFEEGLLVFIEFVGLRSRGRMEEENDGGWGRFNVLVEVARIVKEEEESQEKEINLRKNIKPNSIWMMNNPQRAEESSELSSRPKPKRTERPKEKKPSQLQRSDVNFNQPKKDGSDPISCWKFFVDFSDKSFDAATTSSSEEMPMPMSDSEQPIMAIPEAIYCKDYGFIVKNPSSSKRVRNEKVEFQGELKLFPDNYGVVFKRNPSSSKRVRTEKVEFEGELKPLPENYGLLFKNPSSSKRVRKKKLNLQGEFKPLPENFKNKIITLGGPSSESSITFVFQKVLTATDVNPRHSRLLIPFGQVKDHSFLTDSERDMLENRYNKTDEGRTNDVEVNNGAVMVIRAIFLNPACNEQQMCLTRWDMGKGADKASPNYCLRTQWRKVVEENQLKENDTIQLWGFRKGLALGLALVQL
ncbi:OLC1v1031102C1 [Oldenlandia corymbosa var. corymbosa]|uniref:OLC1v1031102C1 n=1 Tax=Oldenlandia corymbosa var. corymbosa TaxID=529605 RepID=A0AAV1CI85_OLDCO|nr:OLC1v1031102C1 [Oldenlandia corymbosa var. corymbosa]